MESQVQHPHLIEARDKLSPNNLVAGLPGREGQTNEIETFLFERLKIRNSKLNVERHLNKTMFVCGVPGTGKTATILHVIHKLEKLTKQKPPQIHSFTPVYVNGQHLSKPNKIYTEILYKISDQSLPPEKAQDKLEHLFMKGEKHFIVVIDELDLLYNDRRQDVLYSLLDWPTSSNSKLILLLIANAMDLPERFMRGRINSRLGWDKLVFESYTGDCLATIVRSRLGQKLMDKCFDKVAITLATKRIGRTTGDARRILDTCRLAIDKALSRGLSKVTAPIVDEVGFHNLDEHRKKYIMNCNFLELCLLKCILVEAARVGEEAVNGLGVYTQLVNMIIKNPVFKTYVFGIAEYHAILNALEAVGMIYLEPEKPILEKRMYLRASCDSVRDLIRVHTVS